MPHRNAPIYILVIDDNDDDVDLVKSILESEGYRVSSASTCAEARKALAQGSYEVLIVDLKLPDGDGVDLLTFAREKDPDTVAIVVTAYSSTGSAVAALHHGAYDYLSKPCPPRILAAAVGRAVEKQRLTRALAERTAELEALNKDLNRRVGDSTRQIYLLNERLKRFVVELLESNEGRVRFMETLAHELKNPLSVVRGYASFLLSRPMSEWTGEELEKAARAIGRNSEFLQAMLDELMEATSVSKHKIDLRRKALRAGEEAASAVDAFQPQSRQKGVIVAAEVPEDSDPVLEADPVRLRQILSNLIANAIKFTPEGGRVTVRVRRYEDSVQFTVQDTGLGIPEKHLARIFDRFYQAEASSHHKGLGLGLEIAKGLVTLHGGRIWAESEPGRGASFHFILPSTAPAAEETVSADSRPAPAEKPRDRSAA